MYTKLFLYYRADDDIFRTDLCLALHDILDLGSLYIRQGQGVYHHVHGSVIRAERKSSLLQMIKLP